MNNLYIRKLTATQARGNQIDIPKTIVTTFFGVSEDVVENGSNESILVFHRSEPTKFEEIEIQGATNPRFSTKLNRFLENHGYELEEGDLLVVDKVGRSFGVSVIKKDTSNYDALEELFEENEKHMLLTAGLDESQHEAISEDKCGIILFAFDDPTKFVWECIKHFNKQECLKELFESKWFARSGFYNNYYTINGCFVAKEDTEGGEFENIEIFNNVLINNNFEVRTQEQIDGFIEAINILFSGRYKILQEGDFENATYKLIKTTHARINLKYLPYLAALRTKPFMLLAGISGTGKSRIARQIAKACWKLGDADYGKNNPSNFCLVQVKPNWHDSTELLGFVSRIGETPRYVTGDFLPFIAKAWENLDIPHILCLDEMNLAPVEQYFAEYLSVIESRKLNEDGTITTDPIIKKNKEDWYRLLTAELTDDDKLRAQFLDQGITLPPNLFVIGTVNMDETTFSFSRKVLDRAMTIEMNEVDLEGGLTKEEQNELGEIGNSIIGLAVEGKDVYEDHKDYCNQVIDYLKLVNEELENTPFKIAYRTRNEFLLYAVNRKAFDNESNLETALDEMTSMKILPRIEGDSERVKAPLEALRKLMQERGWDENESISLKKIKEMLTKLQQSGYTSYWT